MAYTAGDYLFRCIMTSVTGLPEDEYVNDWAAKFVAGNPLDVNLIAAIAAIGDFYSAGATATDRVGSYIGEAVNRGATHRITATQIVAGPMGAPRLDDPWLGPSACTANFNLPTEVAGVLSFHADLTGISEEVGNTRPRARRRGRVFIGPLAENAMTGSDPLPSVGPDFSQAMRANANVMADALTAAGWQWSVWSRADELLRPVVGGWTDDAPDTQRRRGQQANSRIVFTP